MFCLAEKGIRVPWKAEGLPEHHHQCSRTTLVLASRSPSVTLHPVSMIFIVLTYIVAVFLGPLKVCGFKTSSSVHRISALPPYWQLMYVWNSTWGTGGRDESHGPFSLLPRYLWTFRTLIDSTLEIQRGVTHGHEDHGQY